MCTGCATVNRCPKYYRCVTCHSNSYCASCCGCYERQRQAKIKERAQKAEAEKQQRIRQEQERKRQEWIREQERERQERIRQQQERKRQEWIREQERERQERIRQEQERKRQEWIREQERERQERIRQQQERERQAQIRQQQERERQAVLAKLDASIVSVPVVEENSFDCRSAGHVTITDVVKDENRDEAAYLFVDQGLAIESTNRPALFIGSAIDAFSLTRYGSNGSIASLGSSNGHNHADRGACSILEQSSSSASLLSSLSSWSSIEDCNDCLSIAASGSSSDSAIASLSMASNRNLSLITPFLARYTAHLSPEAQTYFSQKVGKYIETKLSQVDLALQESIIDYFTDEGLIYPYVVQHYPVSEWMVQSLLKEVVSYADEDDPSLNGFRAEWLKIMDQYSITDQISLLKSLRIKKIVQNLSLLDITHVIKLVLDTGASGYGIACSASPQWLFDLNRLWLKRKLTPLLNFSLSERNRLISALAHINRGIAMTELLVEAIQDEAKLDDAMELLSAIESYGVPDSLIRSTIMMAPIDPQRSKAKQWAHILNYHSLLDNIYTLSPQLAESIKQPLYNLLESSCSPDLLEKFIVNHLDLIDAHPAEFVKILKLLHHYQVTEAICLSALSFLPDMAPADWVAKIDGWIVSNLFQDNKVYTTDELIQHISASSSALTYEELRSYYDAIVEAYRSPSLMLQSVNDPAMHQLKIRPIGLWSEKEVTLWAKEIKSPKSFRLAISKSELIAGVKRAVELHHGFSPRDTQLLSLLVLLNPDQGMGRLAQINTGEGKSLVVAMLAAIHGLQGKKVDVVTTSTELSIPEVKKQQPFFEMLALTVAENSHMATKVSAYNSDIVYGIAGDFQSDILRTEFLGKDIRGDRGFHVVIVDEVDSMLFDNRSHSVRLSDQTPGMTHLELPLAAIWEYMQRTVAHLTTIDNEVFFIPETFRRVGQTIQLDSGTPWRSCAIPVSDKGLFITGQVQSHLEQLLRELSVEEKIEYGAYKALNNQINTLEQTITSNPQEKKETMAFCASLSKNLKNLPWNQRYPVLDLPIHLRDFARSQIPYWIKNALNAAYGYKQGAHYTVQNGRIVPIHYNETGVLQPNMVWSDGLTQFLQLKEGLRMDPEAVSTNFISNISFFQRYGCSIYGLTGTLGEASTRDFLHAIYHTDTVIIPPYQYRNILNNSSSAYLCKELRPIVLPNETEWFETILDHALNHAGCKRGVLVICKYIHQVKYLAKQLSEQYDPKKITTYTGEDARFEKSHIDSGEIIIATNIAGRGTDLATTPSVESHGGMYVIVTFLPESYRVEMQNIGRTARSGKKGMAQLIIYDPIKSNIEDIKKCRDQEETLATDKAGQDAQKMLLQDRLFAAFLHLESQYLPAASTYDLFQKWKDLTISWQAYAAQVLSPATIAAYIHQKSGRRKVDLIQHVLGSLSDKESAHLTQSDQAIYRNKISDQVESEKSYFENEYKNKVLNDFFHAQSHLPEALVACFKEGRVFEPNLSDLAKKYNWGLYDRKGFEEAWGFWFKTQHFEEQDISLAKALEQFHTGFANPAKNCVLKDQLVRNPYFYVLKGNQYLDWGNLSLALACYDRAIDMDPDFSVNALYNKAYALLMYPHNKGERQTSAYTALKKAKEIISTVSRPALLTFSVLISQNEIKIYTSEHVQHQLNLLSQQENYIDKACIVIDDAQENDFDVKLTVRSLSETMNRPDQDHTLAIREAAINGFTRLFTIEKVEPIPWHSIVGLALISLTQITAGCLITACTMGTLGAGLISEGVSDMITTVKSAIQGSFDWAAWATQKAIGLAVSVVSFGIQSFKNGLQSLENACQNLVGKLGSIGVQDGVKAAAQELGVALGEGVLNELARSAAQWSTNKLFMENWEQNIRKQTKQKIIQALLNNPLVVKGLELDVKNGNNRWQNCFIREGLSLLKEEKQLQKEIKALCQHMVREIALGVGEHTGNMVQAKDSSNQAITQVGVKLAFTGMRSVKAVDLLLNYTNAFIDKFNEKIQLHEIDIQSAPQEMVASTSYIAVASVSETLVSNAPPIDLEASDITIDNAQENTTYTSVWQARLLQKSYNAAYQSEGPSNPKTIADAFKDKITSTISDSVRKDVLNPTINWGTSALTTGVFRQIRHTTANFKKKAIASKAALDESKHNDAFVMRLNKKKQEKYKPGKSDQTNTTTQNRKDNKKIKLNKYAQAAYEKICHNQPIGRTDIALICNILQLPFELYDTQGRLYEKLGTGLASDTIRLVYNKKNGIRNYEPLYDDNLQVTSSGNNNGILDAIVVQLNAAKKKLLKIKDGNSLRALMKKHMYDHVESVNKAYKSDNTLSVILPNVLRNEEGFATEIIKNSMAVSDYIQTSPALKNFFNKSVQLGQAGSFMKGLGLAITSNPVGLFGSMVLSHFTTEFYDALIAEGSIDRPAARERIADYLQRNIDADISRKEALWAAHASIDVIKISGELATNYIVGRLIQYRYQSDKTGVSTPKHPQARQQAPAICQLKKYEIDLKCLQHIFRNKEGHLSDTPANRKLLEVVANDPKCKLWPDKYNGTCYGVMLIDGNQIWVRVRDTKIINGGMNDLSKFYNSTVRLSTELLEQNHNDSFTENHLTIKEAYFAMVIFLETLYNRTGSNHIGSILGDLLFDLSGDTMDPAAWYDWLDAIGQIQVTESTSQISVLTIQEAYFIMLVFLKNFCERTNADGLDDCLNVMQFLPAGHTIDPVVWDDWLDIGKKIKERVAYKFLIDTLFIK